MIMGFGFNRILVEKKKKIEKNVKVKHDLQFLDVREEKFSFKTSKKGVVFDFKFFVKYEPGFANMEIEGSVSYMADEGFVKNIEKKISSGM